LGFCSENAVNAEFGQRKTGINQSLLNLFDSRPATTESQKALIIKAGLQYGVAGKPRRLKIVAIADGTLKFAVPPLASVRWQVSLHTAATGGEPHILRLSHCFRHAVGFLLVLIVGLPNY
jgi:hypothetical protein